MNARIPSVGDRLRETDRLIRDFPSCISRRELDEMKALCLLRQRGAVGQALDDDPRVARLADIDPCEAAARLPVCDEVTLLPLRGFGLAATDFIPPDTSRSDKVQSLLDRAPTCLSDDQYRLLSQACAAIPQIKGLGARLINLPTLVPLFADPLQQLAALDPCAALSQIPRCMSGSTDPGVVDDPPPGPTPTPLVDEGADDEPNYALWGGLILVVVATTGYAVYRGLK